MSEQKIILDVSSILSLEIGTSQSFSINEEIEDFDKEVTVVDEIKGKVTVNHLEENQLLGFFSLKTVAELVCARCLKKFRMPLELVYEQSFSTKPEEDSFPIFGNRTIDIFPSIKQEVLLSIPIKPVCAEKCKGVKVGRS